MLDFIRTLTDPPPGPAVRFSDQDQTEARQRRELLENARQQAQTLLRQAQEEADALRKVAFQEGYGQGVIQAATDMARTLIESQALAQQRRAQLADAARQLLGVALHREELLDDIVGQWLSEQATVETGLIEVILPQRCECTGATLVARLRQRWCAEGGAPHRIRIEYHDRECYLVRLADQVLEFDVQALDLQLSARLLAAMEEMPQTSRQLTAASQIALANLLKAFVTDDERDIHPTGAP